MTLKSTDIHRFDDISYDVVMPSVNNNNNNDNNHSIINHNNNSIQSFTNNNIIQRQLFQSIAKYDNKFAIQRFGWLGGDVASSIAIPNSNNYIWLFGDSLIGTSDENK